MPGNAAEVILGSYATPARVRTVTRQMGLDQPLLVRYGKWLWAVLHGNLGASVLSPMSVDGILAQSFPVTLELTIFALTLSILVAVPLGLLLAEKGEKWWSRPAMGVLSLGISVPGFVFGMVLIIAFAVELHILPSGGYVGFAASPGQNLKDLVLPTITLSIYVAPALTRFVRGRSVEVLREEYIDVARAEGLSRQRSLSLHVAPDTAVMSLTYFGLQFGGLLGGAIVKEVMFGLPGLGATGLDAYCLVTIPSSRGPSSLLAPVT